MALKGDHPDFTYRITWDGGYVLNITNSKGIVDYSGADPVVDLSRCPPWVPNHPYTKVFVTLNRGVFVTLNSTWVNLYTDAGRTYSP